MPKTNRRKRAGKGATQTDTTKISEKLAARIGRHKYDMWFGHTSMQIDGDRLEVSTASQFVARWIGANFAGELRGAAREALGQETAVDVRVAPDLFGRRDSEDDTTAAPPEPGSGRRGGTRRGAKTAARAGRSLDEFVVGECNQLAFSAATRLVDESDGAVISPIFIHGECGVGKTHLLQGVGQRFGTSASRRARSRYLTGEQFTNEYLASLRNGSIETFRTRMRKLEFLAVDDVHFLSNKVRTQGEFLHTLDAINLAGGRVVLASDEHPRLIKRFSQALISRFLSGMVVKVDRPDRATRCELVTKLASTRGMVVNEAALEMIAAQCVGSVRELEGAVTKLAALKSLADDSGTNGRSGEVGIVLTEQLFKEHGWQSAAPVRITTIIDAVCNRLGVSRHDLMGSGRHRRVVLGRALVAHLGREMTTLSYPEIAHALGRSYHSTVHTAAQRLKRQMANDEEIDLASGERTVSLRELVDQLRHEIRRLSMRSS